MAARIIPSASSATQNMDAGLPVGTLVMYEHEGAPLVGVVLGKKKRIQVLTQRAREVELDQARLHVLPGVLPSQLSTQADRVQYLQNLMQEASAQIASCNLQELWSTVCDESKEGGFLASELSDLCYGNADLPHYLTLRLALLQNPTFFKRDYDRSGERWVARSEAVVREMQHAEAVKADRARVRALALSSLVQRLADKNVSLPAEIQPYVELLEDLAVTSPHLDQSRYHEARELLDAATTPFHLDQIPREEDRAYALLERIDHFGPLTNPSIIRYRPATSFSEEVLAEARKVVPLCTQAITQVIGCLDLTAIPAFTIDDASTQDMDDALSLEILPQGYRIGIHISDVASAFTRESALERCARSRATSIYAPDQTINMLPPELAQECLSLKEEQPRQTVSCLLTLDSNFTIQSHSLTSALIRSRKKYSYVEVERILATGASDPESNVLLQLHQFAVSQHTLRQAQGAQRIQKGEVQIKVDPHGKISLEATDEESPARSLIAEMMVLANRLFAEYAAQHKLPFLYRGQPASDEGIIDPAIPAGPARDLAERMRLKRSSISTTPEPHATLGLRAYTQVTSPIRRYLDLCNQRQLVAHLRAEPPPYSVKDLQDLAASVEEPLSIAATISKESRRFWLLRYLQQERPPEMYGIVTRIDHKNPMVELEQIFLPIVVRFRRGVKLGERVRLKIINIDPKRDFLRAEEF
jgi:exoribonuclease II